MIKLEQNSLPCLDGFFDSFSATKIKANEMSYGFKYPFLLFWCQYINANLTAVICKTEQSVILVANGNADLDEIKDFLSAVGYSSLEGEYELIKSLVGENVKAYNVVFKKSDCIGTPCPPPNIGDVFKILYGQKNKHIAPNKFEPFYADLSHKIRHGTASATLVNDSATAVASHITKNAAVISGVATLPDKQGNGLGAMALGSLEQSLCGRNIFAAVDDAVLGFYLKSGYQPKYKIAIYEYEE